MTSPRRSVRLRGMSDHNVNLSPAIASKTYDDATNDLDLVADADAMGIGERAASRVRVGVGGKLTVVYRNGVEDTIELNNGDVDEMQIVKIKKNPDTTAEKITVYWYDREG